MPDENFYNDKDGNLDLRYPEIAIAAQRIDRMEPGVVKFIIPILTPNLNTNDATTSTVYQNNSNIQNKDKESINIDEIEVSNFVEIYLPRELCTLPGTRYDIYGHVHIIGTGKFHYVDSHSAVISSGNAEHDGHIRIDTGDVNAGAQVSPDTHIGAIFGGYADGHGNLKGQFDSSGTFIEGVMDIDGYGDFDITEGWIETRMSRERYIEKGSKWIVVFVGGDVNKPRIIARYPDPDLNYTYNLNQLWGSYGK